MALGFMTAGDAAARPPRRGPKRGERRGMGFHADGPETVAAAAEVVKRAGRYEDEEIAHVAPGEMIIPLRLQEEHPELVDQIRQMFVDSGLDPDRYVVADTEGTVNITGMEEFYDAGDGSSSGGDSNSGADGTGGDAGSGAGGVGGSGGSDPTSGPGMGASDPTGPFGGQDGEAVNDAVAGAEGTNAADQNGRSSNADAGSVTADDIVGFVAKALTSRFSVGLPMAQRAFTGINQDVRDMGISVVDGVGDDGTGPGASSAFGGGSGGNGVGAGEPSGTAAAIRQSTADQPSTMRARPRGMGFAAALQGGPRINPKTGAQEFNSLDYILPNGVTIGFGSTAERDAYLNSSAGSGAQTQQEAVAQAPAPQQVGAPAPTIDDIKSERGAAWNSPGGEGHADAMKTGKNDPTSDPAKPQPFSITTLQAAGIDANDYFTKNAGQSAGNWVDYGPQEELNKGIVSDLQAAGYTLPFNNMGEGQLSAWIQSLSPAEQTKVQGIVAARQAGGGGTTVGGIEDPTAGGGTGSGAGTGSTSVADRLDAILASDSPLMQRARSQGQMAANRRGLLNSSIAGEAAQAAMIDAALPIASQDADISNQQLMQGRDIDLQKWLQKSDADLRTALQAGELGSQRWIATLDADTRTSIANLQAASSDREKIGAMIAAAQQNYSSQYNAILGNENIPADRRDSELTHIANVMQAAVSLIEQSYGVDLTWNPAGNTVTGA